MWWVKLIYLILVIGLAVFTVLYIDSLALILLICALVLPGLLLICLLWAKLTTQASLNCKTVSCTIHESIPISMIVENRCPLFFPKIYASVSVCHAFSDKPEKIRLRFPLHSRNHTKLTFYVKADCCGAIRIRLNDLHILDYFHLFHVRMKKLNDELEILILPEKLNLALQETAEAVYAPDSDRYAPDKPGDDPSETFNIREYHPGDAVSRIHWKLSSKSDTLFIREFGYPIEKQVLLLAEYLPEATSDRMEHMQSAQAFLTMIYSMAIRLTESDSIAVLAWHDGKRLFYQPLRSGEQIPEIFREMYHALEHMTLDAQDLREILADQQYSSVTLMTNDQHAELLPVLEHQTEAGQKNLVIMTGETLSRRSDSVTIRTVLPDRIAESIAGLII